MNDMSTVIVPKSDQINSDDLIAGPMTISITGVAIKPGGGEQPVAISFKGDNGKPWKPCKSMSRVLVAAWGADANKYVGRSLTLYRDPAVKWAGSEVGGIRISHMSHIDKPITMSLTATRGSRKPHTVNMLAGAQQEPASNPPTAAEYESCDGPGYKLLEARRKEHYSRLSKQQNADLETAKKAAFERLSAQANKQPPALQQSSQSTAAYDEAALLLQMQDAAKSKDPPGLEAAWTSIVNHYESTGAEIPVDVEAAYHYAKESLAQ